MNILVTGASKGIGNAIAKELEKSGNLYVTGRNEKALRECVCKDYCVCDLSIASALSNCATASSYCLSASSKRAK